MQSVGAPAAAAANPVNYDRSYPLVKQLGLCCYSAAVVRDLAAESFLEIGIASYG